MLKDLFKKSQYATLNQASISIPKEEKPNIPSGMWTKCNNCGSMLYCDDLEYNLKVCNSCNFHFRLTARERISQIFDKESFKEYFGTFQSKNPLGFEGYEEKLQAGNKSSGINEAVVTGVGKIHGKSVCAAVMDSFFMMGSMGTVVGEKITSVIELAIDKKMPLIIFTTSGGARMQEGIFSLMQMAKISAALAKLDSQGLLYITVITNPTTGGVTASFAMEGDITISEPGALIGFAGRRVIENTIRENLPDDFQTAEFLIEKGFVDSIVNRKDLRGYLYKILNIHGVM